jgi:hypothetical protein
MNAEHDIEEMRRAFAALAATAQPLDDCPEPARLWAAARGEAPDEIRDLIDHTASCPVCAEAWRLALRLEDAAPAGGQSILRRPAVARWWPAAAAAALVVALVGGYQLREPASAPVPTLRSGAESGLVSDLAEGAVLPRDAGVLAWHVEPAREGLRYAVQVTTDDLRPLVTSAELETPRFAVPASALAQLPPGARILWRVEAFLPDGRPLTSQTFSVRIE